MISPHKHKTYALTLATIIVGTAIAGTAITAKPNHRVGLGDSREGYENPDYESASERLKLARGEASAISKGATLGLPRFAFAQDADAVALGRRLFFDRRLSANETLSCAMCHIPEQGFTQNEMATPVGIEGRSVRRNAPSLYNVAYLRHLFHDGREVDLAAQIWEPLLAHNEMGNTSRREVIEKLRGFGDYTVVFEKLYDEGLTARTLGLALAAYQRSLLAGDSPFDRWMFGGDKDALSPQAQAGFEVFNRVGCVSCHAIDAQAGSTLFTNQLFYNTGIGYRRAHAAPPARVQIAPGAYVALNVDVEIENLTDHGREEVTSQAMHHWQYRVPTLRNVAVTPPYMHDGSLPTLEAVIAYYNQGGEPNDANQDPRIRPLNLSEGERGALVVFLESLTSNHLDQLANDARSVTIGER